MTAALKTCATCAHRRQWHLHPDRTCFWCDSGENIAVVDGLCINLGSTCDWWEDK